MKMKFFVILAGFAFGDFSSIYDVIWPYFSEPESTKTAKRVRKLVDDNSFNIIFTSLDTNRDKRVNLDEVFDWLEFRDQTFLKPELVDQQLNRLSVLKRKLSKSRWNKEMSYSKFKTFWSIIETAAYRVNFEWMDENKDGVLDKKELSAYTNELLTIRSTKESVTEVTVGYCKSTENYNDARDKIRSKYDRQLKRKPLTLERMCAFQIELTALTINFFYCSNSE